MPDLLCWHRIELRQHLLLIPYGYSAINLFDQKNNKLPIIVPATFCMKILVQQTCKQPRSLELYQRVY